MTMEDCLFCKIVRGDLPATVVYEDEYVLVFPDIHPQKPIHLLVVSKQHISEFVAIEDHRLFMHMSEALQRLIREKKLEESGYRIMINGGGHQDVNHVHIHLMGPMGRAAA